MREHAFWARLRKLSYLIGRAGRLKFAALFVLMAVNALLETAGIGSIPLFVLILSSPETVLKNPWAGPILAWLNIVSPKSLMIWGCVGLVGLFTLKNIFFSLVVYLKTRAVYNEQVRMGDRLFQAYINAPYTFFLSRNSAELLRNVHHETKLVVSNVIMPALQLALDGLMLLAIAALLLTVEPMISLLTFSVLGIMGIGFARMTSRQIQGYGRQEQQQRKRMRIIILESIAGIKDIKVLGREKPFLKQYHRSAVRTVMALRYKQLVSQLPKPFMETVTLIGILVIVLALLLLDRQISTFIPLLALFVAATARLVPVLKNILSSIVDIRYHLYAIDPVYDDLTALETTSMEDNGEFASSAGASPLTSCIEFKNIGYRYPQGSGYAVREINLSIPKGAVVGFIGPSGAGKTTLVDILLGLLEPQEGEVLADGWNIFEDVRRWRANVGYIPQFIHLSDDTIRRNIALGLPDDKIDNDRMREAVRAAQLDDLIATLPEGLDTIVRERGVRLSGGQRQRIGIARALYNNPQVLIMDEATSALDNLTEKTVIEAIERLRGDRTIIMIAHRLTTVQSCDRIYLFDQGRLLEQGDYRQLVPGSYAARNKGLSLAVGDVIAFTDADCRPKPDWIMRGVEALVREGAALAGGRVVFTVSDRPTTSELIDASVFMQNEYNIKDRRTAVTANLFVRRDVFNSIGLFEEVRSGGDYLWTKKATSNGFSLIYAPEAIVHHPARRFRALMEKSYRVGSGFVNLLPRRFYALRVLKLVLRLLTPIPSKVIFKLAREHRKSSEIKKSYLSFWSVSYAYQLVQAVSVVRAVLKSRG